MLLPPTARLPPIVKILSRPFEDIWDALQFLRCLYCQEVRGSQSRCRSTGHLSFVDRKQLPESSVFAGENGLVQSYPNTDFQILRSDAFERSYAIKWLTALIARAEDLEAAPDKSHQTEIILQEAASLLAICAGTASAGTFTRIFIFTPNDRKCNIEIQLTDVPLDNHDFSSVGAQTWGSACVLAERIVQSPERFGLIHADNFPCRSEPRVLELGAGTGLVSLTLGKLLESPGRWSAKHTTIVATDFYPSVLANLQKNIASNFAPVEIVDTQPSVSITSRFLDWSTFCVLEEEPASPFDTPFDLVLGADIVYEAEHAGWIKGCLTKLLRKPTGLEMDFGGIFHLVVPLRPTHMAEANTHMVTLYNLVSLIEKYFPATLNTTAVELKSNTHTIGLVGATSAYQNSYFTSTTSQVNNLGWIVQLLTASKVSSFVDLSRFEYAKSSVHTKEILHALVYIITSCINVERLSSAWDVTTLSTSIFHASKSCSWKSGKSSTSVHMGLVMVSVGRKGGIGKSLRSTDPPLTLEVMLPTLLKLGEVITRLGREG